MNVVPGGRRPKTGWLTPPPLDSPAWEVFISPPQFIIRVFVPVTFMLIPPPTQLPVCDAHLSVPPLTSGGPAAVGVARCWEGRRPRQALQRTASKIQRIALKFVREGRRRQKTRYQSPALLANQNGSLSVVQEVGSNKKCHFFIHPCQVGEKKCDETEKNTKKNIAEAFFFFNYTGMKAVKPCNHVLTLLLVLITAPKEADGVVTGHDCRPGLN